MHILGITGPINHGKTTTAKLIAAQEPKSRIIESWQVVAEVADMLNSQFDSSMINTQDLTSINSWIFHLLDILPVVVNQKTPFDKLEIREHELDSQPDDFSKLFIYVDRAKDNPDITNNKINESNKETYRPLLQWLGSYIGTVLGRSVWFDEIVRRVEANDQENELIIVSGLRYPADAEALKRQGAKILAVKRPGQVVVDIADPTERNRENIEVDCQIINNGNLDELEKLAIAFMVDLKADHLRSEYRALH